MYIDVHWSFILLFSQVIFSFKEPYVHYVALKKFWKKENNRKPWIKFRVLLKRWSNSNGSLWTQQSFSRSKSLMYTTLHLKKNVLKKENNRKPWITFRVLLKRWSNSKWQSLNSTTPNVKPKKLSNLVLSETTTLLILKWADN